MVWNLTGRVTLLTNCCTSMGEAIGQRLGKAGSTLLLTDLHSERLADYASKLKDNGVTVHTVDSAVDLRQREHRKALINTAKEKFGGLDHVIANMGDNEIRGDVMDMTAAQFDEVMERYVTVPFRLAQDAMPLLQQSKNGSVLFLSSMAAYSPFVDCGLYAIAQSTVVGMCKALAMSAARRGVRINSLGTGIVRGDGTGAIWDKPGNQEVDQLCGMIPAGRLGEPSDCVGLVAFLLSDQARYITGENALVTGGICSRF